MAQTKSSVASARDSAPRSGKQDFTSRLLEKISTYSMYILIFLLPFFFLPKVVNSIYLGKQYLASVLILISVIALLVRVLLKGESIKYIKNKTSIFLGVLAVGVGLSTLFSGAKHLSFWGFGGSEPFTGISVVLIVALFFLSVTMFTDKQKLHKVMSVFAVSSIILFGGTLLLALLTGLLKVQFLIDIFGTAFWNPYGSANALAVFASACFVWAFATLFAGEKIEGCYKRKMIALTLLSGAMIFVIGYKSAFLLITLALLCFLGLIFAKYKKDFVKRINIPLLLFVAFLMFYFFGFSLARFFNFPAELGPSVKLSFGIGWESMTEGIKNFFLGSGPSTFAYDFAQYKPEALNLSNYWNIRFASGYAAIPTIMAELGLLGLMFFGIFIIYNVLNLLKKVFSDKVEESGRLVGFIMGFVVLMLSLFMYPLNFVSFFYMILMLALALGLAAQGHKNDIKTFSFDTLPHRALIAALVLIAVLVGSTFLLFISTTYFIGEVNYTQGLWLMNQGKNEQAIGKFQNAVSWYKDDQYYRTLSEVIVDNSLRKIASGKADQNQVEAIQTNFQVAINLAAEATEINPLERENWLVLGETYEKLLKYVVGADQKAVKAYAQIESIEPNNPIPYLAQGRTMYTMASTLDTQIKQAKAAQQQKDQNVQVDEEALLNAEANLEKLLNDAENKLKEALAKKNNFEPAYLLLAKINLLRGDTDTAIYNLFAARSINPRNLDSLFVLGTLLNNNGEYQAAGVAMENLLKASPDNANVMFILGLVYDAAGLPDRALELFNKILEKEPENKTVQQVIANIEAGKPAVPRENETAEVTPSPLEQDVIEQYSEPVEEEPAEAEEGEEPPVTEDDNEPEVAE